MQRRRRLVARAAAVLISAWIAMVPLGGLAQTATTTAFETPAPVVIDGIPFSFWALSDRVIEGSTTSFVAASPADGDTDAALQALERVFLESPSAERTQLSWRVSEQVDGEQWFAVRVELSDVGRWKLLGPSGLLRDVEAIGEPVAGPPATTWFWVGGIVLVGGLAVWERIRVGRSEEADELRAATRSQDSWWWG